MVSPTGWDPIAIAFYTAPVVAPTVDTVETIDLHTGGILDATEVGTDSNHISHRPRLRVDLGARAVAVWSS